MTTCASTPNTAPDALPVAVGVIRRGDRVLLARRPAHVHQGGLWEFPGGKREPGEDRRSALIRELDEELGIRAEHLRPLIRLRHAYPERTVELDVWQVDRWQGEPHGREGQPLRWVAVADLHTLPLPAANRPIVTAVRLPSRYLITGPFADAADFRRRLQAALAQGIRLVQFRAHHLDAGEYLVLAREAVALCHAAGARLLINGPPDWVAATGADGVHLTRHRLLSLTSRPLPANRLVAASTHDAQELRQAQAVGVDFSVLSPVAPTASHPGVRPLGWRGFAELVRLAAHPVYALGGLGEAERERAWEAGGQGVAAIRAWWP